MYKVYHHQLSRRKLISIAAIACLENDKKKRRFWVSPLLSCRKTSSFSNTILPLLRLDDSRFQNHFRMSATQMENLLELIGNDIKKQTFIREPISVPERLIITLRYLLITFIILLIIWKIITVLL